MPAIDVQTPSATSQSTQPEVEQATAPVPSPIEPVVLPADRADETGPAVDEEMEVTEVVPATPVTSTNNQIATGSSAQTLRPWLAPLVLVVVLFGIAAVYVVARERRQRRVRAAQWKRDQEYRAAELERKTEVQEKAANRVRLEEEVADIVTTPKRRKQSASKKKRPPRRLKNRNRKKQLRRSNRRCRSRRIRRSRP